MLLCGARVRGSCLGIALGEASLGDAVARGNLLRVVISRLESDAVLEISLSLLTFLVVSSSELDVVLGKEVDAEAEVDIARLGSELGLDVGSGEEITPSNGLNPADISVSMK